MVKTYFPRKAARPFQHLETLLPWAEKVALISWGTSSDGAAQDTEACGTRLGYASGGHFCWAAIGPFGLL